MNGNCFLKNTVRLRFTETKRFGRWKLSAGFPIKIIILLWFVYFHARIPLLELVDCCLCVYTFSVRVLRNALTNDSGMTGKKRLRILLLDNL